jgi:hypothetical protein
MTVVLVCVALLSIAFNLFLFWRLREAYQEINELNPPYARYAVEQETLKKRAGVSLKKEKQAKEGFVRQTPEQHTIFDQIGEANNLEKDDAL